MNLKIKPYHSISTPLIKRKELKDITAVPEEYLVEWSIRLFALMNLAWDYVDTILDLCIQMRIIETKPLCRTIRELKRDYDRFRWNCMLGDRLQEEQDSALEFENLFTKDFRLLTLNLETEIKQLDLNQDYKSLVIAVQQALTLIDAVKIYAKRCDNAMREIGVWTCDYCLVQTEFLKMAEIIPLFAGDSYQPNLKIRKLTAQILANRLEKLPIPEKYLIKE